MRPAIHTYKPGLTPCKYAHIKRDGICLNVVHNPETGLSAWTNNCRNIINDLPRSLFEYLSRVPAGWSVLGELWLPGCRSSAIKTAMIESNPNLRYSVFALENVLPTPGYRVPKIPLETLHEMFTNRGLDFIPWLTNFGDPLQLLKEYKSAHHIDVEGFVLKNSNLLDWQKLKPHNTIDLLIKGFTHGQGKYAGLLGAIIVETCEGYEVANVSGMTDEQRRFMSERSAELVGSVCEVQYQNVGTQGRLRHPVFLRLRDDKPKEQCGISQDDDLQFIWGKGRLF